MTEGGIAGSLNRAIKQKVGNQKVGQQKVGAWLRLSDVIPL
jgi:hypothetical protein